MDDCAEVNVGHKNNFSGYCLNESHMRRGSEECIQGLHRILIEKKITA